LATSTTKIGIANRALQFVGYPAISSLQENSRGARAMNRAYDSVKLSELRKHFWNFSIKRASLPASVTPPLFGKGNYFPLPGDFLMLAPVDQAFGVQTGSPIGGPPNIHDWQIEGNQIASNETGPLQIRYVSSDTIESLFDVSFAEALSAALALATAEELTNSNSKNQFLTSVYDASIKMARQRNSFENRPVMSPNDTWITSRL
jgi:hypothetical protein